MIRIFITAVLYFISLFTQAQNNPNNEKLVNEYLSVEMPCGHCISTESIENSKSYEFKEAKFEVKNKDLTFDCEL